MKKFLLGLFTFIMCFTLVGCGENPIDLGGNNDDGTNEDGGNSSGNGDSAEIKLYSDDTKLVFDFSGVYKLVYYYSGETITGLEYYFDYGDAATAAYAKGAIMTNYGGEDVDSVTQKGRYVIVKFKPEAYEDMTTSEVKETYSYLKQIYDETN